MSESDEIATQDHSIEVTEQELSKLVESSIMNEPLEISFGPGHTSLLWKKGTPMPAAVKQIGLSRGVLNENCDGAGI